MGNLKIPYGVNESEKLIPAELAQKSNKYSCPCCGVQLIFREGEVKAKHFAHSPASSCSLESVLHITAKRLIYEAIMENAESGKSISLESDCHNCGVAFTTYLPAKTFSNSEIEVRVGTHICDVVGYRGNSIGLAIEILNTHKVDTKKAANLEVYWVELKAEDVINDPFKWIPTQANLKESYCNSCKNHIKHVIEVADKYSIDRALYSPIKDPKKSVSPPTRVARPWRT